MYGRMERYGTREIETTHALDLLRVSNKQLACLRLLARSTYYMYVYMSMVTTKKVSIAQREWNIFYSLKNNPKRPSAERMRLPIAPGVKNGTPGGMLNVET